MRGTLACLCGTVPSMWIIKIYLDIWLPIINSVPGNVMGSRRGQSDIHITHPPCPEWSVNMGQVGSSRPPKYVETSPLFYLFKLMPTVRSVTSADLKKLLERLSAIAWSQSMSSTITLMITSGSERHQWVCVTHSIWLNFIWQACTYAQEHMHSQSVRHNDIRPHGTTNTLAF